MSDGFIFAGQGENRMIEWFRRGQCYSGVSQLIDTWPDHSHNRPLINIPVVTVQLEELFRQNAFENVWQVCTLSNLYLGGKCIRYV